MTNTFDQHRIAQDALEHLEHAHEEIGSWVCKVKNFSEDAVRNENRIDVLTADVAAVKKTATRLRAELDATRAALVFLARQYQKNIPRAEAARRVAQENDELKHRLDSYFHW